jgi:hypothetical protein
MIRHGGDRLAKTERFRHCGERQLRWTLEFLAAIRLSTVSSLKKNLRPGFVRTLRNVWFDFDLPYAYTLASRAGAVAELPVEEALCLASRASPARGHRATPG